MDASTLSAVSALMGSVVGAGVSLTTTWIAQRYSTRQERVRERARQRERLYSKFISEAAHLQPDAFGHQLDSAKAVVRIAGHRVLPLAQSHVGGVVRTQAVAGPRSASRVQRSFPPRNRGGRYDDMLFSISPLASLHQRAIRQTPLDSVSLPLDRELRDFTEESLRER
jgi:hypothetical protein